MAKGTLIASKRLRAATAYFCLILAGGAMLITAAITIPVFVTLSLDHVTQVEGFRKEVTITYLSKPDFSNWNIRVENGYHQSKIIKGNELRIEGYNEQELGTQEVTLSYLDWSSKINLTILPLALNKPTLSFDNGTLSWQPVEHAAKYAIEAYKDKECLQRIGNSFSAESLSFDAKNVDYYGEFYLSVKALNNETSPKGFAKFKASDLSEPYLVNQLSSIGELTYDGTKFNWSEVEGAASYVITINGVSHPAFDNEYPYVLANPGECRVSVTPQGTSSSSYAKPTEATFTLLPTPEIALQEGKLVVKTGGTSSLKYLLDGEDFDGDLTQIKSPGLHQIKAINIGDGVHTFTGKESNGVIVEKLPPPTLSLVGGELRADIESGGLKIYLDDLLWDKDLAKVEVGEHQITAIATPELGNQIVSEPSTPLTISRLATPIFAFDGYALNESNCGLGHQLFVDGEISSSTSSDQAFLDSLSPGKHHIEAVNQGNGNEVLPSGTASIDLYVPGVNILLEKSLDSPNTAFTFALADSSGYVKTDAMGNKNYLSADVSFKFYQGEELIDALYWEEEGGLRFTDSFDDMAANQLSYVRAGKKATRVEIEVKVSAPDAMPIYQKSITKTLVLES